MFIKKISLVVILISLFILNIPSICAEETTTSEKIAVSLVIDTSGSMADTDPNNLRKTAAEIFIDLLSPEDYLGIVTFSTDVVEAVPLQQVVSVENKAIMKSVLAPAVTATGDTDYLKALQAAEYQLDGFAEPDVRKVIIFLTDGVPDPDAVQSANPAFMSDYMDSIWATTANIGLKDYSIYALGFGNSDQSILQRIASDTRGEAKFIESPGAIATNFFEVLRTLKNRQAFFNESLDIQGEYAIPFSVDPYTSQVTMVLANENAGLDVSVVSSDWQTVPQNLGVQKNDNYSIITLNQYDKELAGEWQLIVNGTGNVQLFGDKDLFFKSWMVEPQTNMQHPVNETLMVSVTVIGELSPQMTVEVLVSKNGIPETNSIQLALKDGYYVGTYDEVDQQGTYSLETVVKDGDVLVTKNVTNIKVQELPSLRTDDYKKDTLTYKLSESKKVTGYLEMRENVVDSQQGIEIISFNLVKNYADGRQEIQALSDNPDEASGGDLVGGDGIYSAVMPFEQEGEFSASLVVQGVYKEDMFQLEEDLGDYRVVSSGEVVGTIPETDLLGKPGGEISVPIHLENYSGRSETVTVAIDPAIGTVQSPPILLESGEKLYGEVAVRLFDGIELDEHNVQLSLAALDPLTVMTTDLSATVSIVSGMDLLLINLKDTFQNNQGVIILIVALIVAFVTIGRLLYFVLVKKKMSHLGYLEYNKKDSTDSIIKFQLPKNFSKISISFGGHNKNADVSIVETRYKYNLNLTVVNKKRMKWVEGYKSLSKGYKPFHLLLNAEAPGIFMIDGEVLTQSEIFDQDTFETGGYTFVYRTEVKSLKQQEKAKNVLEGKM